MKTMWVHIGLGRGVRLMAFVLALLAIAAAPAHAIDNVKLRAVPMHQSVAQGGQLVIAVEMDHGEELHTWPAKGVDLPAAAEESAIRTVIGPRLDDQERVVLPAWIAAFDGTQYPMAEVGKVPDPSGNSPTINSPLYMHKAVSFVRLNVAPDAPLGQQSLVIIASFQACNESMCLPPEEQELTLSIKVEPKGAQPGAPSEQSLFATFDSKQWGKGASVPVAPRGKPSAAPTSATPAPANSGGASLLGFNLGTSAVLVFLGAAIGGMLLNLTPCVLPVIPIKVLTLSNHATSKSKALVLGLWMFAGVVAFWGIIGVPMAFISASFDPSQFIFGIWWITFSIGLIIVILSLGIMGLFTINLPQSVYAVETKADSPFGSFMFGVLTAVLGLPCFGFVAGSLLAAAATLPTLTIMSIFLGIGFGMGLPYLILSVYPQLLKFIPRTGPASELVKQVMGLLLLAAAAFFITAAIKALLKEYPYLAGSAVWWAVGFFVAVAGLWLVIRTFQISKSTWPKVVMPLVAILGTLGIGIFAQSEFVKDRKTYQQRQAAASHSGSLTSGDVPVGIWYEYTPELFAAVRASGRPVFLDFTADWCLTCKALKAAVLDTEAMQAALKDRGIVLMEVDTTVRAGVGAKKLQELGRTGVPAWAIYAPGSDVPRFLTVEKPSLGVVLKELDDAGVRANSLGMKR